MRCRCLVLVGVVNLTALSGCVGYLEARTALELRRYKDERNGMIAGSYGQAAQGSADLVRRGISRYKLGDYDEAIALLSLVSDIVRYPEARLYLALSHLLKREDRLAVEQLLAYGIVTSNPAIAAQIDRALLIIRLDPLSDRIRSLIAASLETEMDRERELREERFAQRLRNRVFPPLP